MYTCWHCVHTHTLACLWNTHCVSILGWHDHLKHAKWNTLSCALKRAVLYSCQICVDVTNTSHMQPTRRPQMAGHEPTTLTRGLAAQSNPPTLSHVSWNKCLVLWIHNNYHQKQLMAMCMYMYQQLRPYMCIPPQWLPSWLSCACGSGECANSKRPFPIPVHHPVKHENGVFVNPIKPGNSILTWDSSKHEYCETTPSAGSHPVFIV